MTGLAPQLSEPGPSWAQDSERPPKASWRDAVGAAPKDSQPRCGQDSAGRERTGLLDARGHCQAGSINVLIERGEPGACSHISGQ